LAAHFNRTWSWQRPLARVVARVPASRDAVTLWLRPNRHWAGFRPGQHVNLTVEVDGIRITRSYSLCDRPRADGRIAITVKVVEGGRLSRHLCDAMQVGNVVELGPAFGDLHLGADSSGPALMLAAGSGITPMMSMIREQAAIGMPTPLALHYWCRTRAEFCFADELRDLAAKHANFRLRFLLTRESALHADEGEGRLSASDIEQTLDSALGTRVSACGPAGFVRSAEILATTHSLPFQGEAFSPAPRVSTANATVTVALAKSGRELQVAQDQSLLEALEAAGLRPASGCRMGICNTCACAKTTGSSRNLNTGDVVQEPVSALKLCIHGAASDLVLDL
jgi:ferredoxin-NADP reductase